MEFKEGEKLEAMLHESGEDIIVSYRTGKKALIKDGIIQRIYDNKNYQEIGWKRSDWQKQEQIEAAEQEQKQLEAYHKAEASKAAKAHKEEERQKQKAAAGQ